MDNKSDQNLLEQDSSIVTKKKMTKEELEKEKERQKQKRLDIRAIEFDWIFNSGEGVDFLKTLANTDNIELFSLTLIRYIIRFLWGYYRKAIVIYLFIPYILYFITFILYTTWVFDRKEERNEGMFDLDYGLANTVMVIFLLVFIMYFLIFEMTQIWFHKLEYFVSFWNMIDLASLLLNGTILVCDLAGVKEQTLTTLMGIAVLFVWLKMFYFGRIFLSTAAMIRMIIEITYDMRFFLLVLIIAIAGFGNCFFIIARNDAEMWTGDNWWRAFLYSYNAALGEFNTDPFDTSDDRHYLYSLWFLDTMITLIIFLNLLIAIMGDTFDRVQQTSENNMLKELAQIMVENELLINRKRTFGDAKYIIIIQEEKADATHESWEGRLQMLKKFMYGAVERQNKLLKNIEKKVMEEVKEKTEKRGKELETSANRVINTLLEKSDEVQGLLNEKIAEYTPAEDEDGK